MGAYISINASSIPKSDKSIPQRLESKRRVILRCGMCGKRFRLPKDYFTDIGSDYVCAEDLPRLGNGYGRTLWGPINEKAEAERVSVNGKLKETLERVEQASKPRRRVAVVGIPKTLDDVKGRVVYCQRWLKSKGRSVL